MIHSVSKDMITVIQCMPRLAERTTVATLVQLKARACLLLSGPLAAPAQLAIPCRTPSSRCQPRPPASNSGLAVIMAHLTVFRIGRGACCWRPARRCLRS